ncbi:unnamed protein product, partial [Aphanomyces euteiches]
MSISSGEGSISGSVILTSADAGATGSINITTGFSRSYKSGNVNIRSGSSSSHSGDVSLTAGDSSSMGDAFVKGSSVRIAAVRRNLELSAGESSGSVMIDGGSKRTGHGGAIIITSGESEISGNVSVTTGLSGTKSGNLFFASSASELAGDITLSVGTAHRNPGILTLQGGSSDEDSGGNVIIEAGKAVSQSPGGTLSLRGGDGGVVGGLLEATTGSGALTSGTIKLASGSNSLESGDVKIVSGSSNVVSGAVSLSTGTSNGESGLLSLSGGSGATGGSITLSSGRGSQRSGLISLKSNHPSGDGGSISVESGSKVSLMTSKSQIVMTEKGQIALNASEIRHIGANVTVHVDHAFEISHTNSQNSSDVTFRALNDLVISHVPIQAPKVLTPSDERIKTDITSFDHDDIYHRLQELRPKSFKYEKAWGKMMGVDDETMRGLVAQEVAEVFPEYVSVKSELHLTDHGLRIENFTQINQQAMVIDLIAALQVQQKRLTLGPDSRDTTGFLHLTTANGKDDSLAPNSGDIKLATGTSTTGLSGDISISTGNALGGSAGKIRVSSGSSSSKFGAEVSLQAGNVVSTSAVGGSIVVESGSGPAASSGAVFVRSSHAGSNGDSGGLQLLSGDSKLGRTGQIDIRSGHAPQSTAGPVGIIGGAGVAGASVTILGGDSSKSVGGDVMISSGSSESDTSGSIELLTSKGDSGSGSISLVTGDSNAQPGGSIILSTGAQGDIGLSAQGLLSLQSQRNNVTIQTSDNLEGSGSVIVSSGYSNSRPGSIELQAAGSDSLAPAGSVRLNAGLSSQVEGSAGEISIVGGSGSGEFPVHGGDIAVSGGDSKAGRGGSIRVSAGSGQTSGNVALASG